MSNSKFIVKMKVPKPHTRRPIKPRQAHKIATRYDRKKKDKHEDS
jgi:hypothetical protein